MNYLEELFSVKGKTALITGGATGLGKMISRGLVAAGAEVFIVSRREDACLEAAKELNSLGFPGQATGFSADISTEDGILDLKNKLCDQTEDLHILANNAGISWGAPFEKFPHAQWDRVMGVNVGSVFTLTRALHPLLTKAASQDDPGRIINIGSIMGTIPIAEGAYSYSMSKAAVHHMTRIFSNEFAKDHITVNALAPGPFPSQMTEFALGAPETADRVAENIPLRRIGNEQDAAGAILYLCARAGAYVSGAILPIDGGMSADCSANLFANAITPQA